MRALVLALALVAVPAWLGAEEKVVSGLSEDRIEITANFNGSDLLIYGAVSRDAPPPTDSSLDVIITVQGPSFPVNVRRKSRVLGIWGNTDTVTVDSAPSFYAIATTRPFEQIISNTDDIRYSVSIPRAIRSVGAPRTIMDSQNFTEALIRIRQKQGFYALQDASVRLAQDTLFRTDIRLPANLVEGVYKTRIFLTRNKQVVALDERSIYVRKVGLERWLFRLSRTQPAIYGALALAIAAFAGWAASAGFRALKR